MITIHGKSASALSRWNSLLPFSFYFGALSSTFTSDKRGADVETQRNLLGAVLES
jgi:hypothetical protein